MSIIRSLYGRAALNKQDAQQLNLLLNKVDSTAGPVLICYKGANEMIQAKYALNPVKKLEKFNAGKRLLITTISMDTLNLEMRFIRYSIQSNLPGFLNYHNDLYEDKRFLLEHTKNSTDPELKQMINNYLSTPSKQLKN